MSHANSLPVLSFVNRLSPLFYFKYINIAFGRLYCLVACVLRGLSRHGAGQSHAEAFSNFSRMGGTLNNYMWAAGGVFCNLCT